MQLISGVWSSRIAALIEEGNLNALDAIVQLLTASTTVYQFVMGYHAKGDGGGGLYYWDAGGDKALHNGGTVIDPGRTFPTDWTNETQKSTWYTAGSGAGVWLLVRDTNSVDGRQFGVKFDNLATPVTDNTQSLQKAINSVNTIYLPGGKYKTSTLQMKDKMKLLAISSKIHFVSADRMILRIAGATNFTDVEFHGILESTSTDITTATDQRGLLLFYFVDGIIENIDFSGTEYICPNCQANGVLFAISYTAVTARTWVKSANFKNCNFIACGIMGFETNNHDSDLVITGITIGAGATFTYTGSGGTPIREGQSVALLQITGTGAVNNLNDSFFQITNPTSTTFQLKNSAGALVSTVGGAYTSGGVVYVYRAQNIDLSGSTITDTGMCGGTTYGIGISISGPSLDIKCNNIKSYDCVLTALEWIGVSKSFARNCVFYNPTGSQIQATNVRRSYDNVIAENLTVGKPISARGFELYNQVNLQLTNNNLSSYNSFWIDACENSLISGNVLSVTNHHRTLLFKRTSSTFNNRNNIISGNVLDNSEFGNNTIPVEMDGNNINYNIFDNNTFKTASNSLANLSIPEGVGASGNVLGKWRNYNSSSSHVVPAWSAVGNVSTFPLLDGSDIRVLSLSNLTMTKIVITLVAFNAQGGQPNADFKIKYAVRNDNTPLGGEINIHFSSYDQKNATPVFWYNGSATPTISTAALNGSSQYFWDITLPTHNGAVSAKIECIIDKTFESSFTVTTA